MTVFFAAAFDDVGVLFPITVVGRIGLTIVPEDAEEETVPVLSLRSCWWVEALAAKGDRSEFEGAVVLLAVL